MSKWCVWGLIVAGLAAVYPWVLPDMGARGGSAWWTSVNAAACAACFSLGRPLVASLGAPFSASGLCAIAWVCLLGQSVSFAAERTTQPAIWMILIGSGLALPGLAVLESAARPLHRWVGGATLPAATISLVLLAGLSRDERGDENFRATLITAGNSLLIATALSFAALILLRRDLNSLTRNAAAVLAGLLVVCWACILNIPWTAGEDWGLGVALFLFMLGSLGSLLGAVAVWLLCWPWSFLEPCRYQGPRWPAGGAD